MCPRVSPQLGNRLSLQRLFLCAFRATAPHMNFPSCGSESTLEARRLVPGGSYRVSPLLCLWGPHLYRIDSLLPSRYTVTAAVLRDAKSGTRSLFRMWWQTPWHNWPSSRLDIHIYIYIYIAFHTWTEHFLSAFAKLRKVTISFAMFFCVFVCPSVRKEQLGSHWKDFHEIWYLSIFRKSVKKIQDSLISGENSGYVTWRPIYINDLPRLFLLRMRNVSGQNGRKIKTHFMFNNFFFSEIVQFVR